MSGAEHDASEFEVGYFVAVFSITTSPTSQPTTPTLTSTPSSPLFALFATKGTTFRPGVLDLCEPCREKSERLALKRAQSHLIHIHNHDAIPILHGLELLVNLLSWT